MELEYSLDETFLITMGWPFTSQDILDGLRMGVISPTKAIALACHQVKNDSTSHSLIDLCAASPLDEDLTDAWAECSSPSELDDFSRRLWQFLALLALRADKANFTDPFEVVSSIYAFFGYDERVASFVAYMPSPPGAEYGEAAMLSSWDSYLTTELRELRAVRSGAL